MKVLARKYNGLQHDCTRSKNDLRDVCATSETSRRHCRLLPELRSLVFRVLSLDRTKTKTKRCCFHNSFIPFSIFLFCKKILSPLVEACPQIQPITSAHISQAPFKRSVAFLCVHRHYGQKQTINKITTTLRLFSSLNVRIHSRHPFLGG